MFKMKAIVFPNGLVTVLYIISLVAIIVFLDVKYLRYKFWLRLVVNISIVVFFAVFWIFFIENLF